MCAEGGRTCGHRVRLWQSSGLPHRVPSQWFGQDLLLINQDEPAEAAQPVVREGWIQTARLYVPVEPVTQLHFLQSTFLSVEQLHWGRQCRRCQEIRFFLCLENKGDGCW